MNEENKELNIRNNVLDKVRAKEVSMRPRAYFVVRFILTVSVALLALVVSALVISFILFSIHESGEQFLLGFGRSGISTFFLLFPWGFFLLDVVILLFLEWLLKSFKFGYRVSFITVFLLILICSSFLAIIINLTPLQGTLLNKADQGSLPILGEMYESIRDSHQANGVFRGTVTSIQENKIVMTHDDNDHDADDGTWTVIFPPSHPDFQVGDNVYVFGTSTDRTIYATGIGKLSSDQ